MPSHAILHKSAMMVQPKHFKTSERGELNDRCISKNNAAGHANPSNKQTSCGMQVLPIRPDAVKKALGTFSGGLPSTNRHELCADEPML